MATEVAKVVARLEADIRDFERGMRKADRRLDTLEGSTRKANKSLGGMASVGKKLVPLAAAGFGLQQGLKFVNDAVGSFSDLEESVNAVQVQFGEGAQAILDFGETAATEVGLANSEFNQLSVVTGALFSGFIDDAQLAAEETIKLTKRAADMASVFNVPVQEALLAVQASLRGEQEPIRRFGVLMDETSVAAKALELGLAGTTKELTTQDKSMARLAIIYEQTEKVAGDFANTQDSVANKMKVMNARLEDAKAAIGEALTPVVIELVDAFTDLIPAIEAAGPELGEFVRGSIRGTSFLGNLTSSVVNFGQGVVDLPRLITGSTRAFDQFAEASRAGQGALDDLFNVTEDAQDAIAAYGVAAGEVSGAQQLLNDEMAETVDVFEDLFRASQPAVSAIGELSGAQALLNDEVANVSPFDRYARTLDRILNGADRVAQSHRDAADAVRELTRAQAAAINPVVNLLQANTRLERAQDALNEIEKDGKASAADMADAIVAVVEAQADVIGSRGELVAALGDNVEAFRDMATRAGIAKEQIDLLIQSLFGIPSTVATDIVVRGGRVPAAAVGRDTGGNIALASGGIVTRPTVATIGESGPEAVIPLDRASGIGGDTFILNVEQFITVQDDATAAQRILEETQDALDALAAGRA